MKTIVHMHCMHRYIKLYYNQAQIPHKKCRTHTITLLSQLCYHIFIESLSRLQSLCAS